MARAKLTWHQVCVIRAMHEQGLRLAFDGNVYRFLDAADKPAKHGFVALGKVIRQEAVQALINKGYLTLWRELVVPTTKVKQHFTEQAG